MANKDTSERLESLEKQFSELVALVRFQDSKRVEIEKCIGAIDQQLIKTDAGLHLLRKLTVKSKPPVKSKPKSKTKPKLKVQIKPKTKSKLKIKVKSGKRK